MKAAESPRWQGWLVWLAALALAWMLPGAVWHAETAPAFPRGAIALSAAILAPLVLGAPLLARWLGPEGAKQRLLAVLEGPPDFLWGGLLLAAWPAGWGPPGPGAFTLAFLAAALPSEVRWICAALPPEAPFPAAYGTGAVMRSRSSAIRHLFPRWLAARLPWWLTAALVLERMFGVQGLGSDWAARIAFRDHLGLAVWVLVFAMLWRLTRSLGFR